MAEERNDHPEGNPPQGLGGERQAEQRQGQHRDQDTRFDHDRTHGSAPETPDRDAGQGGQVGGPNQRDSR